MVNNAVNFYYGAMLKKKFLFEIKSSKGKKDRYTLLSNKTLEILKVYWMKYKPESCLFGGAKNGSYLSILSIQTILKRSCEKK